MPEWIIIYEKYDETYYEVTEKMRIPIGWLVKTTVWLSDESKGKTGISTSMIAFPDKDHLWNQ